MSTRILCNRASSKPQPFKLNSDGWFQVLRIGEWPHTHPVLNARGEQVIGEDGKGMEETIVQVCDREACEAIVAQFNRERETIQNHPGMLLDYDHFSYDRTKSTEAAGWIEELVVRDDGVWASPRFSNDGKAKVEGGTYRLISPVLEDFEALGGNRLRPRRMDSAGLTNRPNIWGMPPWSNREASSSGSDAERKQNAAGEKAMDYKKTLCSLLGLNADAGDEDITKAIEGAGAKKVEVEQEMNRRGTEITTLKNSVTTLTGKLEVARKGRIEQLVVENQDLYPAEEIRNRLASDFEGTEALLGLRNRGTGKANDGKAADGKGAEAAKNGKAGATVYQPKHNRNQGAHPQEPDREDNSGAREVTAARIANRVRDLTSKGTPYGMAFTQAEKEIAQEDVARKN